MENTDNLIGCMLDDRYEILEKIGSGGMAVVYKARCHRLNRFVAIKILKGELAHDPDFRRRFHAESQAVAMLSDPNIVAVYDVSTSDDIDYIVMELIEGITLKQYINRKGLLNWKEALHFSTQIAKALKHAHSRGIIHRDIKPHNIMILKDGSVKVADFGIARLLSTQHTLTNEALGSVHYISPEQAKGGQVDARTDLYSLGVVMYEMMTNRLPFEGESAVSVAIQHISSVPLSPRDINPDVPIGLEQITMHAMEPSLAIRYASADELLRDLEDFRKNPSTIFNYVSYVPEAHQGAAPDYGTKVIPTDAVGNMNVAPIKTRAISQPQHITKDEYSRNRRRASKTSLLVGVFFVIAFLVVMAVFMWNYLLKDMLNPTDERITVPSFVGSYYSEVKDNPEYTRYYNFTANEVYSKDYPAGYIISQNPAADRQMTVLDDGIEVVLEVSKGDETYIMPDFYAITDYREAINQLEKLGLDLTFNTEAAFSSDITSSYIIDQIPEAGETITRGMTIHFIYSKGPEKVLQKVPNLVGYTESKARSKLDALDLKCTVEYEYSEEFASGIVTFQNVDPDSEVEIHSEIVIFVSKGPEPTPSPSPSFDPTSPTDDNTTPTDNNGGGEIGDGEGEFE